MHTMMTFFLGLAVGLPIGGLLMWAFGSRVRSEAQKVATELTSFTGKTSGK